MPRPVTKNIVKIKSFGIPEKYEATIKALEELAAKDKTSFGDKVLDAIAEYVSVHYPGNPQVPLESFINSGNLSLRLEAKFTAEDLERAVHMSEKPDLHEARPFWLNLTKKYLIKIVRLNDRLPGRPYQVLINKAGKLLGLESDNHESNPENPDRKN